MAVPVIFDLDPETGEATGIVRPFCSDECRNAYIPEPLGHIEHGQEDVVADFGFVPKCEQCGDFVIKCERCGRTTEDPDLWDPEADTGRIFCDACWPKRDDS